MKLKIPVLEHGPAMGHREKWKCENWKLPEPVTYKSIQLRPDNCKVVNVDFGTVDQGDREPWTIVWITAEVADGMFDPLDFGWTKPVPKNIPETVEETAARVAGAMKSQGLEIADVIEEHQRRMADAAPEA